MRRAFSFRLIVRVSDPSTNRRASAHDARETTGKRQANRRPAGARQLVTVLTGCQAPVGDKVVL